MVFGRQVLAQDLSPGVLALAVLPTVLPLAAVVVAVAAGSVTACAVVGLALVVKVAVSAGLRRAAPPAPVSVAGMALEVVADLLVPVHLIAAAVRPGRVTWRDRDIVARPDGLLRRHAP
jgi:hypothetical protein